MREHLGSIKFSLCDNFIHFLTIYSNFLLLWFKYHINNSLKQYNPMIKLAIDLKSFISIHEFKFCVDILWKVIEFYFNVINTQLAGLI